MAAKGDWRVGSAERDSVAGMLADHYAAGRLTLAEFQSRLDAAYAATTASDLAAVTAGLPAVGGAGTPGSRRRPGGRRRRSLARAAGVSLALYLALLTLIAVALPHGGLIALVLGLLAAPFVLLAALAAAVFWAARRAWRSGAWLEALPLPAGGPWAGRAVWFGRAFLAGRSLWRGHRVRRPGYYRYYQREHMHCPGGAWR